MIYPTSPRFYRYTLILLFVSIAILYSVFHGRYMAEYLDDVWSFSWAWNLFEESDVRDTVFGSRDGGTLYFQRTFAFVYGAVASLVGWSRGVGHGISKFFVLASAACWFFIVQKLGYQRKTAWVFVGIMLLLEAYFGISNKIRQEPLALFLCSLAFLLFIKERYFFSGLVLGIAVETHPFAFIGGFWALAYVTVLLPKFKANPKRYVLGALFYLSGLAIGFAYWLALHLPYAEGLGSITNALYSNVFAAYFFTHRYSWRHWPELFMIVVALILFIVRRKYLSHPFVLPFIVSVVLASFLVTRGNLHYIVYIYPSVILLILTVAEDFKIVPFLILSLLLFQLPQYAWLFWSQKDYDHSEYISRIRAVVAEAEGDDEELIYGNPNAWFAFQERDFRAYGAFGRAGIAPENWPEHFLVLENSDFDRWNGRVDLERGKDLYVRENIASWLHWDGKPYTVYRMIRR